MKPTKKLDRRAMSSLSVVGRQDHEAMWAGFAGHAQLLLPMLEPIQNTRISVDELMHGTGWALAEQLLAVSAQEVAGDGRHPGRTGGDVRWQGSQARPDCDG